MKKVTSVILVVLLLVTSLASLVFADGSVGVVLTDEEKAFIESHPVITLGVDPDFKPFEFIDSDGHYQGLASDYVDLINQKTGLNMVMVNTESWDESYNKAMLNEVDVLPCVAKTTKREGFFLFSDPYYQFERVIFMRDDTKGVSNFNDLNGKTVAVQGQSSHDSFMTTYEEISLSKYENVEAALRALEAGKEDYFVGNLATTNYEMRRLGMTHMKYVVFDHSSESYLYFAVSKEMPILRDIINKGLNGITEAEAIAIRNKWIGTTLVTDYSHFIRIIGVILILIVLIMIVSGYWILKLKGEIRKRAIVEEELRIARREAELANEVKSNFMARMSHEIRTPLNAITGLSYLLEQTDLTQTQGAHIDKIKNAANVMLSIINDILDFSKIEAGKIDIEKHSFNLDDVIQNVLNIVTFKIDEKKLDFTLVKDPKLPTHLVGDSKRIEQVLLNIINNAVKFTMEGGITLRVNLVGFNRNDYHIEFIIEDTGIGMSQEHQKNLFEPFSQEDASINRRFGGTGLGLSIVKSLVEMMDGSVKVESEQAKGTKFIICLTLPCDQEKENSKTKGVEYIRNIKTLVLNKDMEAVQFLTESLRNYGIIAEFTSSKKQFRKLVFEQSLKAGNPYDLVIVDDPSLGGNALTFLDDIYHHEDIRYKPKAIILQAFNHKNPPEAFNEFQVGLTKPIFSSNLYNCIADFFKFDVVASQAEYASQMLKDMKDKGKVLIIEDNKTNQFIAKTLLESVGFNVSIADHGQEGVKLWSESKYDIILMDLHMPVMNGYEATQAIRKEDKETPIVAMTADALTSVEEKCRAFGINYFISKPFDPENFKKTIQNIFYDYHQEAEMPEVLNKDLGLKMMGGSESLYHEIVQIFLMENHDILSQIEQVKSDQDFIAGRDIMHKVKSSSASLGAEKVSQTAKDLQEAFEAKNSEAINQLIEHFEVQFKELLDELEGL